MKVLISELIYLIYPFLTRVVWATERTKLLVKSVCETARHSSFWAAIVPVYQDLSTRHNWPVKKTIVNLPIRLNAFPVIY